MLKNVSFVVAAAAAFVLTACSPGRDFTVKRTISVKATSDKCQVDKLVYNLGDDAAFATVKKNIGKVEVKKLAIRISNPKTRPESVATLANGEVHIGPVGETPTVLLSTYGDVPVEKDAYKEIPVDAEGAKTLTNLALKGTNAFEIQWRGCADQVPAYFDFDVEMTLFASLKLL